MNIKWIKRFKSLSEEIATWSEDTSTQVGAVIVNDEYDILTQGWNGLPRGVKLTPEREERPTKYFYFEHAERNAIYNATRNGVTLKDATIFVTHYPCADCARAIIQSGIRRVYFTQKLEGTEQWDRQNEASEAMLTEAGVELWWMDFKGGAKLLTRATPE